MLHVVTSSRVLGAYTGESERRLREAFAAAQADADAGRTAVVFLDEVGTKSGGILQGVQRGKGVLPSRSWAGRGPIVALRFCMRVLGMLWGKSEGKGKEWE